MIEKNEYHKARAEMILFEKTNIIMTSNGIWPGHGYGDENHNHGGPPGQTGNKPGWGNGGVPPGQQGKG